MYRAIQTKKTISIFILQYDKKASQAMLNNFISRYDNDYIKIIPRALARGIIGTTYAVTSLEETPSTTTL